MLLRRNDPSKLPKILGPVNPSFCSAKNLDTSNSFFIAAGKFSLSAASLSSVFASSNSAKGSLDDIESFSMKSFYPYIVI